MTVRVTGRNPNFSSSVDALLTLSKFQIIVPSNAGGSQVLAYGNMRQLCLGLEVVLPTGEIWDGLRKLKKDNTGYDLRDLYLGAEGTLGIITRAVLRLWPKPKDVATAWVAVATNRTPIM